MSLLSLSLGMYSHFVMFPICAVVSECPSLECLASKRGKAKLKERTKGTGLLNLPEVSSAGGGGACHHGAGGGVTTMAA